MLLEKLPEGQRVLCNRAKVSFILELDHPLAEILQVAKKTYQDRKPARGQPHCMGPKRNTLIPPLVSYILHQVRQHPVASVMYGEWVVSDSERKAFALFLQKSPLTMQRIATFCVAKVTYAKKLLLTVARGEGRVGPPALSRVMEGQWFVLALAELLIEHQTEGKGPALGLEREVKKALASAAKEEGGEQRQQQAQQQPRGKAKARPKGKAKAKGKAAAKQA